MWFLAGGMGCPSGNNQSFMFNDLKENSLQSTIAFHRPELLHLKSSGLPIPLNPPQYFFAGNHSCLLYLFNVIPEGRIPGIGELMLASFPPLNVEFMASISKKHPWYDYLISFWV